MGLVERIRIIRGMAGLSPRTKSKVLKELLEPFIDNQHRTFKAESFGTFKREYQRAPKYMKEVIKDLYGSKMIQKAGRYHGGRVPVDATTEIKFDLRGLDDSPDVSRFYEDIPPRP